MTKEKEKIREQEASLFARRFLMPREKIEEYFKKTDGDIFDMSIYFQVEYKHMKKRLKELDLI